MHQARATEVPRAFVVRRTDSEGKCNVAISKDEIYEFARKQLASYKALEGGIIFVNSIPRTASSKIQRFKLAKMSEYHDQLVKRYSPPRANGKLAVKNADAQPQEPSCQAIRLDES